MASALSLASGIHGLVFTKEVMVWRGLEFRKSLVRVALWREDGRKMTLDAEREVRSCFRNRGGKSSSLRMFSVRTRALCGEGIWKDRRMNGGFTVFFVDFSSTCCKPGQIFRVCAQHPSLCTDVLG